MEQHSEIFSKVSATMNKTWKECHHDEICDILKTVEEECGVDIFFIKGAYQFTGTFEEIKKAHETLTCWPPPGSEAGAASHNPYCRDICEEASQKNGKLTTVECASAEHTQPSDLCHESLLSSCYTEGRPILQTSLHQEEASRRSILVDQNLWKYLDETDISDRLKQLGQQLGVSIHHDEQKFQTIRLEPKEGENRVDEACDAVTQMVKEEMQKLISVNISTAEEQEDDDRKTCATVRDVRLLCEEGKDGDSHQQVMLHETAHILMAGPELEVMKEGPHVTRLVDTSVSKDAGKCYMETELTEISGPSDSGSREVQGELRSADVTKTCIYDREKLGE